jgi:hypothetical protein
MAAYVGADSFAHALCKRRTNARSIRIYVRRSTVLDMVQNVTVAPTTISTANALLLVDTRYVPVLPRPCTMRGSFVHGRGDPRICIRNPKCSLFNGTENPPPNPYNT